LALGIAFLKLLSWIGQSQVPMFMEGGGGGGVGGRVQ